MGTPFYFDFTVKFKVSVASGVVDKELAREHAEAQLADYLKNLPIMEGQVEREIMSVTDDETEKEHKV